MKAATICAIKLLDEKVPSNSPLSIGGRGGVHRRRGGQRGLRGGGGGLDLQRRRRLLLALQFQNGNMASELLHLFKELYSRNHK